MSHKKIMDIHSDIHTRNAMRPPSLQYRQRLVPMVLMKLINGLGAKQTEHLGDPAHQQSLAAVASCPVFICRGVWVAQWAAAEATSYVVGILIEERP